MQFTTQHERGRCVNNPRHIDALCRGRKRK
jgi:hypothetical protein